MIMNTFFLPQKHQIIITNKWNPISYICIMQHHVINSTKSQNEFYKFEYCSNCRPTFYMRTFQSRCSSFLTFLCNISWQPVAAYSGFLLSSFPFKCLAFIKTTQSQPCNISALIEWYVFGLCYPYERKNFCASDRCRSRVRLLSKWFSLTFPSFEKCCSLEHNCSFIWTNNSALFLWKILCMCRPFFGRLSYSNQLNSQPSVLNEYKMLNIVWQIFFLFRILHFHHLNVFISSERPPKNAKLHFTKLQWKTVYDTSKLYIQNLKSTDWTLSCNVFTMCIVPFARCTIESFSRKCEQTNCYHWINVGTFFGAVFRRRERWEWNSIRIRFNNVFAEDW